MNGVNPAGRAPTLDDVARRAGVSAATARDVTPGLTTVRIPLEQIGAAALRLALSDDPRPLRAAPAEVVLRASTPDLR